MRHAVQCELWEVSRAKSLDLSHRSSALRVPLIPGHKENGKVVYDTTIDASEAGIGFRSEHRLRFGEIVKIKPSLPDEKLPEIPWIP
jgi:hypothetical protein